VAGSTASRYILSAGQSTYWSAGRCCGAPDMGAAVRERAPTSAASDREGRTVNYEQLPAPPGKRRRWRNILGVAAAVVVVGALTGTATIALLRNGTLSSQVTAANARAANAVTSAQAAAKSDYAARNAALNREAARLKRQNQDVAAKIGELRANSIRAHGKYVVGHDIKSGTWHTVGDGGVSGSQCAYVVFSSAGKPSIPNFFDGPWTVDLSSAYAFEIKGPCTWMRVP